MFLSSVGLKSPPLQALIPTRYLNHRTKFKHWFSTVKAGEHLKELKIARPWSNPNADTSPSLTFDAAPH